jgi:hypothetical protein
VERGLQRFRGFTLNTIYDHERVVAIAEAMDAAAQLPPDFMLLQPASHHPTSGPTSCACGRSTRLQAQQGREKHLCPLPFDIVDRADQPVLQPG